MPSIPTKEVLNEAAKQIKELHEQPNNDLSAMIGDSIWFESYLRICFQHPIANALLGAILFGWQLREKTAFLECSKIITDTENGGKIHLA